MAIARHLYSVNLLVIVLQVISVPWMAKGFAIGAFELIRVKATDANNFKRFIPIWVECAFTRDYVAELSFLQHPVPYFERARFDLRVIVVRNALLINSLSGLDLCVPRPDPS